MALKKIKCGGFLFKSFEHESLIRSTNIALAGNGIGLNAVHQQSRLLCGIT